MSYTEQQLADLYTAAVAAEVSFKKNGESGPEGFDLEIVMETLGGREKIIRTLIDQLRAAGRRPAGEAPDPGLVAEHCATMEAEGDMVAVPRGLLGTALGAISHPSHTAAMTVALLKAYAYQRGGNVKPEQLPINTGLSWEDYRGISSRADVHEAVQDLLGDTTEDNACNLVRAIAEALRPRPRFWLDMHGYSCHLLHSEAEAVAHCNETGGLYVLPLFAGEPINTKLPMSLCRPATEPETLIVSHLLANLRSMPQRYTSDHVSLADVYTIIEALRGKA